MLILKSSAPKQRKPKEEKKKLWRKFSHMKKEYSAKYPEKRAKEINVLVAEKMGVKFAMLHSMQKRAGFSKGWFLK